MQYRVLESIFRFAVWLQKTQGLIFFFELGHNGSVLGLMIFHKMSPGLTITTCNKITTSWRSLPTVLHISLSWNVNFSFRSHWSNGLFFLFCKNLSLSIPQKYRVAISSFLFKLLCSVGPSFTVQVWIVSWSTVWFLLDLS